MLPVGDNDSASIALPEQDRPTRGRSTVRPEHLGWRSILFGGLAAFAISALVMFWTENPNLYATVVLVGSFLIPVAFVAFLYDHLHWTALSFEAITWAFVTGGVLGVLGASILEPALVPRLLGGRDTLDFGGGLAVAVIEEGTKLAAVAFVARHIRRDRALDGLLLGTAVGMGFAALESTGYAFTVLFATGGDVVASLVETVVRALIAPFGHGIWTGIAAAALFRSSAPTSWRLGPLAWLAFAFVVVLHASWDGLRVGGSLDVLGFPLSTSIAAVGLLGIAVFAVVAVRLANAPRPASAEPSG